MNALLKKEIQILLPTFTVGLIFAFLSGWAFSTKASPSDGNFSTLQDVIQQCMYLSGPVLIILISLQSFGAEVSAGTFSNLLAQPISRKKIWRLKTFLLGTAIFLVWLAWWRSSVSPKPTDQVEETQHIVFLTTTLFTLTAFSGALWTILLFRQVAAAFWFTLIVPVALMIPILLLSNKYPNIVEPSLIIILSAYSLAGFFFARHLFLRAQDVQWSSREIVLPEFRNVAKQRVSSRSDRKWRPRMALYAKEFHLHQSSFIIAGVIGFLHVGALSLKKFGAIKGSFKTGTFLASFWIIWILMPLIIGCTAVSEERKLGTLENQLCLPVRRRTQFWIKFTTAFSLSLFFGFILPVLLEGPGLLLNLFPPNPNKVAPYLMMQPPGSMSYILENILLFIIVSNPLLISIGFISLLAVASFYTSTLSRNTLQTLLPAIVVIGLALTYLSMAPNMENFLYYPVWLSSFTYPIYGLTLVGTLFALMFWNFKHAVVGWNIWRKNVVIIVVSLVVANVMTTAIYHRCWEFLAPLEPAHGSARLRATDSVKIQNRNYDSINIQFSDGKVWMGFLEAPNRSLLPSFLKNKKMTPPPLSGEFLEETNWQSVIVSSVGMIGIKKDGSLWGSKSSGRRPTGKPPKLVRLDHNNDWKTVVGHYLSAFLLKQDGTIWHWEIAGEGFKKPWPQSFKIQRAGEDSDWADISQMREKTIFRKIDGRTYVNPPLVRADKTKFKLVDATPIQRSENLDEIKSSTRNGYRSGGFEIGVDKSGRLSATKNEGIESRYQNPRIQLGKDSDWLAVADTGEPDTVIALKADGSLWKWNFPNNPTTSPDSASAVRLGIHSDWIAIQGMDNFMDRGVISLATDGSLWFWRFDSFHNRPTLLAAPRKPQKIANIFDAPRVP